ncbi:MAG: 3-deoxy-D-manno-octulosonic acid transferase [Gemmatales bacterium]|nr:MAG: 3-deoxy-D-manno-octulosonic acid transferase [Gemmatales bacterium]
MAWLVNAIYLMLLAILFPWLLYKSLKTGKYRRGMWQKITGCLPASLLLPPKPVWFHGVSVGEIHLLRTLVARFRALFPDYPCVVSTTTDTGYVEAQKAFSDLPVFYWPLDFSWSVNRLLRRVDPRLIVLAECELWPNFLHAASRLSIPVAVVNARMSPRSYKRYRLVRSLAASLLQKVSLFAVQTEEYGAWFRLLGASSETIHVTGSIKYDGVQADRNQPRTRELGRLFGIQPSDTVWVAGSTQFPEEQLVVQIYMKLQPEFPRLRLIVVPRQKERFDEVAALLERLQVPYVRRSWFASATQSDPSTELRGKLPTPVVLVDTIGELQAIWGLADIAFVGGSLDGRRGGQNMIEPAAYGAAVLFGPHVWNFRDTANRLAAAGGAIQVADAAELESAVRKLLLSHKQRTDLGRRAQELVVRQQGATERTVLLLGKLLGSLRDTKPLDAETDLSIRRSA